VAVASAGPHASLHLSPNRQPRQHPTTLFFTGWMPFLLPNQQHQSTEGKPVNQLNKNDFQIKKTIRLLSFSRSRWQAGWECLCMHVSYAQMGRQPENIMPLAHLLDGQRH